MVDPTQRDPLVEARYPDFVEQCREDLRDGGPGLLETRANQLERRIEKLTEKAEQWTCVAKSAVLKLLRRHHDDAGDYAGDLDHVAEVVAKGGEHPLFAEAIKIEADRRGSEQQDDIRRQKQLAIDLSASSQKAVAVAKDKLRLVRYMLDDWSRGELPPAVAQKTVRIATETQLNHLRTARKVLKEQPHINTQPEFEEACENRGKPGGSIRKRVRDLAKKMLNSKKVVELPPQYDGFSGGFQQLVDDLWTGNVAS